jgi:TRAP-type C4-dicarboxylate transport system permease small subunit
MYSIAGVALTAMMALTVADVILRFFERPIVGTYEVVGLLGAVAVGFAIPQTSRLKGHVLMDFLTGRLSRNVQHVLYVLTRILACVLFAIIGWNVWLLGDGYRQIGEVTLTIQLPLYPVAYGIAICCFIECLVLILDVLEMGKQEAEQ